MKQMLDKIETYRVTGNMVALETKNVNVYIEIFDEGIINIDVAFGSKDPYSQAVVIKNKDIAFDVSEKDDCMCISTGLLRLKVHKDNCNMEIEGRYGLKLDDIELTLEESKRSCAIKIREDECFYGLGEKTGFLNKRGAKYTMWNTDCYEPHTESTDPLYASFPFFIGFNRYGCYGIYFDNTFRTYFDMGKSDSSKVEFGAEKGPLSFFFIYGQTMKDIIKGYTDITGRIDLPPIWALGYHQSKYSYYPQSEVEQLAKTFREKGIPCDAIYLDIHYMDGYRVFTFDKERFPDVKAMLKRLKEMGFKMVTIIDPGVKVDGNYSVFKEGLENRYFVTDSNGLPFVGRVWPGPSCFPDFSRSDVRKWWAEKHREFIEMGIDGIWNDMNEPAVMDTPSKTMPEDMIHLNDGQPITHAQFHNVYALNMAMATKDAMLRFRPNQRPFILTRAAFSGIQRYAAVWTGDNRSHWDHVKLSIPMLLNMGLSGEPFCGADIGGFEDDCSEELFIRWIQVGVFYPFCRNHNALGKREQEPWAFGERAQKIATQFIKLRYKLLPYIYNLFYESHKNGMPVLRPLVLEYPGDEKTYFMFDEFMLGDSILGAPIYEPGKTIRAVYLPEGNWIDWWTGKEYEGGKYYLVEAPLDKMPLFVKAGAIIPMAEPVSCTADGIKVKFHVFPGVAQAEYVYYEDDMITENYKNGKYNLYRIKYRKDMDTVKIEMEKLYYEYPEGQKGFRVVFEGGEGIEKILVNGQQVNPHVIDETAVAIYVEP
ncbi:glycoside hydrolase family 31 protein [Caldicoprobacter faecalis]|nr:glycoside hydrolase family 31 protein [Caldicoprobacter faecalis]